MVKLLIGHKGSGKTKRMIEMANSSLNTVNGSVVYINKNARLMFDLKYRIRVICMDDFPEIDNVDKYIGFIYGMISQDHDLELIFIDSILKYSSIKPENMEEFLEKITAISEKYEIEFIVSVSANRDELGAYLDKYPVLN